MRYRKLRIALSVLSVALYILAASILEYFRPQPYVPEWMQFLLLVILLLPWVEWPSRFSLRTLLIATTLVAVVLGLILWLSHN